MRTASLVFLSCLLVASPSAAGQDDILKNARAAATSGHREEALSMLETHLSDSPRDVDARLLYGLVLSWEGRYDEARPALQQVLTQTPGYTDARVALMNVEYLVGPFHRGPGAGRSDSDEPARQRHRTRGSRSNRSGEPSLVGFYELFARHVRRWNGALA